MNIRNLFLFGLLGIGLLGACRAPLQHDAVPCQEGIEHLDVTINEVISNNEGAYIDETGATDDYFEVVNNTSRPVHLDAFEIEHGGGDTRLPDLILPAGERALLWADAEPEQGVRHLDFRISSSGEVLTLRTCHATIDTAYVPSLEENEVFARYPDGTGPRRVCRYASPAKSNGDECEPPRAPGIGDDVPFAPYSWAEVHPEVARPLALSEVTLRPARFVELENTGSSRLSLTGYSLRLAPLSPGEPLPDVATGQSIPLDDAMALDPGQRVTFQVLEGHVAELASDPAFEGVLSLFDPSGQPFDRWDFMHYPEGATLARPPGDKGLAVFCEESTPGEENVCTQLEAREVGNRVRALRTKGDFAALAEGGTNLGTSAVKFVVDVVQGNRVHLLRTADWALHYTFIREVIYGEAPLDRCDPDRRAEFNQGWYDFSVTEYFATTGRSFYLGTFVKHGSTGHQTIEFALGDAIVADDMRDVFFIATERVSDAEQYLLRPQGEAQNSRAREVEGELPILEENAPFRDLIYQPLTQGEGYGVLTWVPANELNDVALGAQAILVTDDVPNDLPLVGGLITEAFQTPLAHVNVLSQNRGTPNMALREARRDSRIRDNLGRLVRLRVSGEDFFIEPATAEEAETFWEQHRPTGPVMAPRLDTSERDLVDLANASLQSLPSIGAKAAQMAELLRLQERLRGEEQEGARGPAPAICSDAADFQLPQSPFAIPVVHFVEHFRASGAEGRLVEARARDSFGADPLFRASELREVQSLILQHPLDGDLTSDLEREVSVRFGSAPVRFRSSSNAEDLPGFNGAGLYTSVSSGLSDEEFPIEDAVRTVWASLYNPRAYDERELSRVDHDAVAMGVLVHPSFPHEAANGVGISRNLLDPTRGDIYYLNSQAGEASVTNPAPGVTTEALEFQWPPRTPLIAHQSVSSLTDGALVITEDEAIAVSCALFHVHQHFRPLLDPASEDPWFAMEIEYKFLYPSRQLVVKQGRPHTFSGFDVAGDCREF